MTACPCWTPWPRPTFDPSLGRADWLDRIGCFLELHVEQGRDLVDRDEVVGLATEIWPHGRYRFDFAGDANHAGTTRMEDRHDPMLSFAMTALAASKQARSRPARDVRPCRRRPQRHQRDPVARHRLAGRALRDRRVAVRLVAEIKRQGTERAGRDGTRLEVTPESVSGAVSFDPALTALCVPD